MQAFQHNRLLGMFHLLYGAIGFTSIALLILIFGFLVANSSGDISVGGIELILVLAVLTTFLPLTMMSMLAGYAFLKRKRWAKTTGVIAAVVAGMNFPIGSVLCVYTLWFLFGAHGRFLYHKAAYALPPEPSLWNKAENRDRKREYVPPSTPPDWR